VGNKQNAKEIGQSSQTEINKTMWQTLSSIGFSSNTTRVIAPNRNVEPTIRRLDNIVVKDIVREGNNNLSVCHCRSRSRRYVTAKRLDWRLKKESSRISDAQHNDRKHSVVKNICLFSMHMSMRERVVTDENNVFLDMGLVTFSFFHALCIPIHLALIIETPTSLAE
jgi:hypothetical protein